MQLAVSRGESVAFIGPNGTGKSTLLKLLGGRFQPTEGEIMLGSKVTVGYYDQEQSDLNSKKTVLQELWDEYLMSMNGISARYSGVFFLQVMKS